MSSGEPDDAKVSSPVRRGVCGKVPAKVTRHFPTLLDAAGAGCAGRGEALRSTDPVRGRSAGESQSDGQHDDAERGNRAGSESADLG